MESKAQISMIGDADEGWTHWGIYRLISRGVVAWRGVGPFNSRAEQENGEKWMFQNAIETFYVFH